MTQAREGRGSPEVALIVGGGPGISASCARLFSKDGMKVAVAARTLPLAGQQLTEARHEIEVARI